MDKRFQQYVFRNPALANRFPLQSGQCVRSVSGSVSLESFDLVVIGSGPAGEKGAAQAAYFGKRVAVIERAPNLGGAGVNTGTVPSKTLRESALYFSGLRQRGLYGIDSWHSLI
jgi:NADPH-dependent 2,4-dienoyl-CoA reductase/sulfur reductase-like enzyme